MKRTRALPWLILCLGAQSALAGGYSCANGARLYLENGRERCDDGGMPIYRADTVAPVSATTHTPRQAAPSPSPSEAMARGARIGGVDCRGVDCEVAEGMQAGLATLNLSGGRFSAYDGQALRVVTLDSRNRVGDERSSGVINGRIDLAIPAWRLAGGNYRFEGKPRNSEKVLASGAFAVAQGKDEMKPAEPKPKDRPPPTKAGSSMAGLYWCVAPSWSKGTILLNPDGSYDMNGNRAGRYAVGKGRVEFDGQLKGWNNGVARIEDGNLIFEWKNPDGSMQYYAYARGKD